MNQPLNKVKIYAISFFLAPVGLYWFFKYFRSADLGYKKVAYTALWITLAACGFAAISGYFYVMTILTYTKSSSDLMGF